MADTITVQNALRAVNAYPIPLHVLAVIAEGRGLGLSAVADKETLGGSCYRLAVADLLVWLSKAPDITQGGQSYSFTDEQRKEMRRQAQAVYDGLEAGTASLAGVSYGYKGSRL